MAAAPPTKLEQFSAICKRPYREQAIWFLNAWWNQGVGASDANLVWDYVEKFVELDLLGPDKRGREGCELDAFWSAKFLESFSRAMPALARKEALRAIDVNADGKLSALELLVWHFKKGVDATVDAPQGTSAELEDAQAALRSVQRALEEVRRLERELQAAVADLKKQEDAYSAQCRALEAKAGDPAASTVAKSRAANELAQLRGEDPLPLRKAKITQEAALRKVQRQQEKLMQELSAAQAAVDAAKARGGGTAPGLLWWLQRELFEGDRFVASAKQKFDHKKPFMYDPLA